MKSRVNLSLDQDLTREARELGLNMSKVAEEALTHAVKMERNRKWREENKDALEQYAKRIDEKGLTLEKYRVF